MPAFIWEFSATFPNYFFCLIQVVRCSRGQDGKMSSEFIRIGKKKKKEEKNGNHQIWYKRSSQRSSLHFNVVMKHIIISRSVFSEGHFAFRLLNMWRWRLSLDERTFDDVTRRALSSACRCASVSLRPLTCDDVKGHRWGPWEQRCMRVFAEARHGSKLRKFPNWSQS